MRKILSIILLVLLLIVSNVLSESSSTNYISTTNYVGGAGSESDSVNYITSIVSEPISGETSYGDNIFQVGVLYGSNGEVGIAPNIPIAILESTGSNNYTSEDLNCSFVVLDSDSSTLNVTVKWYEGGNLQYTSYLDNSYANGSLVSAILNSGNTTKNDNWKCSVRFDDGELFSDWGNSSVLIILNSPPVVTLVSPNDGNLTTDRTPTFTWSVTDDDGDSSFFSEFNLTGYYGVNPTGLDGRTNSNPFITSHTIDDGDLQLLSNNGYHYEWKVRANDGGDTGNWSEVWKINITAFEPDTPSPILRSTGLNNYTNEDLNCSFVVLDNDSSILNATVKWYVDGVYNLTMFYNNSYANGTLVNSILNAGNTTKYENWSCSVRLDDGELFSSWGNSSNLTILNSPPNVTLVSPDDDNSTIDRTPTFVYYGTDIDGDNLAYDINLTKEGVSLCSDYNLDVQDYVGESYSPSQDLSCLSDNGDYYEWSVRACENDTAELLCGDWTTIRRINISSSVEIFLSVDDVQFGNMSIGESKNTTNVSLNPLVLQNKGNCRVNVSVNATKIWDSVTDDYSKYFQSKVRAYGGNASWAETSWFQISTITGLSVITSDLNYSDSSNSLDVDLLLEVPFSEPPGVKSSTVNFQAELSEVYGLA